MNAALAVGAVVPRRRNRPAAPPAGIYDMGGTMHGCPCLVAYDGQGEFTFRVIENPDDDSVERHQLEVWLADRGVILPKVQPALFIV